MPGTRPRRSMPPTSTAPVEPAETNPSAPPSRTISMPLTSALSFFWRTAIAADS